MLTRFIFTICLTAGLIGSAVPAFAQEGAAVQYLQRLSQIDKNDVVAVTSLADWAHANNLEHEAMLNYRRAVKLDPTDNAVYQRLARIADTTRLPEDKDRQEELKKTFGKGFKLHVSPHFLVVYDTDPSWALNRAVLLEKTHDIFYDAFRRADLKPLPLTERLVCVLFDTHDEFARYAQKVDRMNMAWSSGYYSTRTNRIAFFHDRNNPAHQKVVRHLNQLEKKIDDLREKIRQNNRNPALVGEFRRELDGAMRQHQWYRNRLRGVAGMANTAKTTHEAVHQLAFNSDLQRRGVMYPFWLAEGLATNFETDDPAAAFGPFFDNPERRNLLSQTFEAGNLMPLGQFAILVNPPTDDADRISQLYAQAYGLFQFLFKKRHNQMRQYLRTLSEIESGQRSKAQLEKEFADAFGPIDELERQFHTWLRQIR